MATNPNNAILFWLLVSHQPDPGVCFYIPRKFELYSVYHVIKICIDSLQ